MTTFCLLLGIVAQQPATLTPRIASASIFKNGYAVVLRTMPVQGPGTYILESLPAGAMGTVWFRASEGTTLEDIATTEIRTPFDANLGSLNEIVMENIGKKVRIEWRSTPDKVTVIEGTLKAADGEVVVIDTGDARVAINKAGIYTVQSTAGALIYSVKRETTRRVLSIKVSGKPGEIGLLSLERGFSWAPAYAVDITDKKELKLTAKATLLNDHTDDLKEADARLITGFPNVPFANVLDPLFTGRAAPVFNSPMGGGFGGAGGAGAFGGPGGPALGMNSQRAAKLADFDSSMALVPGAEGDQREDLFFYTLPKVSLNSGQRKYQILFSMKSAYTDIFTWDIADSTANNVEYRGIAEGPQDVWHALKFKNTSGQPLTTSVATTFDAGEIIGQDTLGYVPNGAETELRINKSLDIRAEGSEVELQRERGAVKNRDGYPIYDLVTIKGTLELTNMKRQNVATRVQRDLTGEIIDKADGAQIIKTTKGLTQMNPTTRLTYKRDLKPGEKLSVSYQYKLYVRSAN
jgi:hypothetical protein